MGMGRAGWESGYLFGRALAPDRALGSLTRTDSMQMQQMALEIKRRKSEQLQHVESAMERLRAGSYGDCCRCGKPIPQERLEVFPDAVLCVGCASSPRR